MLCKAPQILMYRNSVNTLQRILVRYKYSDSPTFNYNACKTMILAELRPHFYIFGLHCTNGKKININWHGPYCKLSITNAKYYFSSICNESEKFSKVNFFSCARILECANQSRIIFVSKNNLMQSNK